MNQDLRRWSVGAAAVAVVLGALLALSIRGNIKGASTERHPSARSATAKPRPIDQPVAAPMPEPPAPVVAEPASPMPSTAEADVPEAPPARAPRAVRGDAEQLADVRDAILDATPEALVKGKPIRWSAGEVSGYVVPSERQDDGDRVCRNIYATVMIGDEEQRQGRAQRWCRAVDDTGWAPE